MTNYPYILKTGSIKKFLEIIPSLGVPDKVTNSYIYSLGFKSTNDRAIPSIMKFLKFIDASGNPTERYRNYRDKSKAASILGGAVKEAYMEVFKIYPDAHKKDHQTLQNFFSTCTGLGERAVKSSVETFKALSSLSNFNDIFEEKNSNEDFEQNNSNDSVQKSSLHNLDFVLSEGRKARIIIPQDVTSAEIEKLKKLLDVLK